MTTCGTGPWVRWLVDPADVPHPEPTTWTRAARAAQAVSYRVLTGSGAPLYDPAKAWDEVNVGAVAAHLPPSTRILDCGAFNSGALNAFVRHRFRAIHGIDLDPHLPAMRHRSRVVYTIQDMQRTEFEDEDFDLVSCSFTIEHGVSWEQFAAESRRLLRSGGLLYLSTDVVREPVGEHHRAFGLPWLPLLPEDVQHRANILARAGFEVAAVEPPTLPRRLAHSILGVELGFVALLAVAR